MENKIVKGHELVNLHREILNISFANYKEIRDSFFEVAGIHSIDHLSINIANPDNEMVFLSSTPTTGFNICSSGLWKYDGSISPTYFKSFDFYFWEQAYRADKKEAIKMLKEKAHNFGYGFVAVRRAGDFFILYSFATKNKDPEYPKYIETQKEELLKIGDHCYNQLKTIYSRYSHEYDPPKILTPF